MYPQSTPLPSPSAPPEKRHHRGGSVRKVGPYTVDPDVLKRARHKWESLRKKLRPIVFERDGYKCVFCGKPPSLGHQVFEDGEWVTHYSYGDFWLVVDHIRPLAKGGTNDLSNLQTLCGPCNGRKRDRWEGDAA